MKRYLIYLIIGFCAVCTTSYSFELTDWMLINSALVQEKPSRISSAGYSNNGWYSVTLPSTVLQALIQHQIYPDPRIGLNNYLIPDASDEFNAKLNLSRFSYLPDKRNPWLDPYWFRTEFEIPASYRSKIIWLDLNGINYRADVWLNGHQVASKDKVYGMFRRFTFDISSLAKPGAVNALAVKIYQVDHPGTPNPGTQFVPLGPVRGNSEDLYKDETLKFSGGWDCAPVVRDRNMGIYRSVVIRCTDKVIIQHPDVVTVLPYNNDSLAQLKIAFDVKNISASSVQGKIEVDLSLLNEIEFPTYKKQMPGSFHPLLLKKNFTLAPNECRTLVFSSDEYKELNIKHPYLWYPIGYGEQYLHHLSIRSYVSGHLSDKSEFDFGMRQVKTSLHRIGEDAGLVYHVNGKRIFCKGGWIQPDILLVEPEKRIYDEVRLMAEANVNIIGSEDMPTPADAWLDACDKYGIMWWHIFLQCWRMYPGTATAHYPLDHELVEKEVKDIIYRYRTHPSIISWIGVNEVIPDEDLYQRVKRATLQTDPSRHFIPTTSISWDVDKLTPYLKPDAVTGTTDDGAPDYGWAPSAYFFDKVREVHLQQFRNELGMPAMPAYASLKKFIPEKKNLSFDPLFPLDSVWAEHGAWDVDNYCYRAYDSAIRCFFGPPTSMQDYCKAGQYLSADGYRAMFEAANHRMWSIVSGVMIWKLNSCWPDVCWQIYDWYLHPTSAYFFAKKAMEPIHIQLNSNDFSVSLINTTSKQLSNMKVSVKVIGKDNLTCDLWSYDQLCNIPADTCLQITEVPRQGRFGDPYFVRLQLRDEHDTLVSDNLYTFYSHHMDYLWLMRLKQPKVRYQFSSHVVGNEMHCSIQLENPSDSLASMLHLSIVDESGKEILPIFWSDNFLTLFPGEKRQIEAIVAQSDINRNSNLNFIIE